MTVTITIELPAEMEEQLRAAAATQDAESVRRLLADAAAPTVETLLRQAREDDPLDQALAALASRTPEETARMQEEALAAVSEPRPLPPGKTLFETVGNQWPGDETDEQVAEALARLS